MSPGEPIAPPLYRVAPPDGLNVSVRPEPVMARQLTIRPDGHISFDLIGDVQVEGKTVDEIRVEIQRRLREFIVSPDVTVELTATNSRRYYIFGEVRAPGSYPLLGRTTAVEALAQARGETRFASLNSARLVRYMPENSGVYGVRYSDIMKRGDPRTNYELQPDDVIYMPPTTSARIGYAIQVIFFPIQQILGLGGRVARSAGF
jgi:polysaccharide export outer membrane protein